MSLFDSIVITEPQLESYEGNKVFEKFLGYVDEVYSEKRYKDLIRMIKTSPKLFDHEKEVLLNELETCKMVNRNNGKFRTEQFSAWNNADVAWRQRNHKELKDIEN